MNKSNLYLIGNGFDLHHGLPTRYSDFQKFIEEHYPDLEWDFEEHFRMDVDHQYLWRQFENDLSTFDWESFFNRYNHIDVGSESFRPSEAFGLEDELVQEGENIVESIKSAFREWIESLDYPESISDDLLLGGFEENSKFITFNYTDTLERYYGIDANDILYIHNKADDNRGEIIFGHGTEQEPKPRPDELDEEGNSNRTMFTDAEDAARSVFYELQKDTGSVIVEHRDFLERLSGINGIVVLGHSLGKVDWPYLKYFKGLLPNAFWQFSYYGEQDMQNIKNVCSETLELNWKDVQLIRLYELIRS
ncbi:bacteriophage abortive infection AbiH family protein [Pedobacter agri]|uniref:bacteriophage abortive infection AbiH family protein n=1 Tax=Pedobacter agri TaxID=454586 RepID=UPI002930A349|nr:bacteriophage abortive infection AbiH family protein [Pedobacter agri]